ncbi:MAG: DUF2269 family protein [Caldilineaceae bacterium]
MTMPSRLRKFVLTTHIAASVGWIGAVVAYLVLVITAMGSQDAQTLRAAWIAMDLIGWLAIVPLAIAALITGVIMALGTKWGLFQHYWVLASFALTLFATIVLLGHMQLVSEIASLAMAPDGPVAPELRTGLQEDLGHAGIGLLVLLVVHVLNVYKPRGLTPFGRRKQREQRLTSPAYDTMA